MTEEQQHLRKPLSEFEVSMLRLIKIAMVILVLMWLAWFGHHAP